MGPLTYGIWCYFQVDSVRLSWAVGQPDSVREFFGGVGKKFKGWNSYHHYTVWFLKMKIHIYFQFLKIISVYVDKCYINIASSLFLFPNFFQNINGYTFDLIDSILCLWTHFNFQNFHLLVFFYMWNNMLRSVFQCTLILFKLAVCILQIKLLIELLNSADMISMSTKSIRLILKFLQNFIVSCSLLTFSILFLIFNIFNYIS